MEKARRKGEGRIRKQLGRLLADEDRLDVVEAALLVAAEEYPSLDVAHTAERIREFSAAGASRVEKLTNPFARLDGLRTYMFEELEFRGNLTDFNDPRNSYLNDVVDRHLGIPLTLSMLYLELGTAAGFVTQGIALPGHFVAGMTYEDRTILVDPFNGGRVITEDDCRQLVGRATGRPSLFRKRQLAGTSRRAMLGRLLLNLKHIYLGGTDYARALRIVELLLMVTPGDSREIRDRGFLEAHLGRPAAAIADLETYLTLDPRAPDKDAVRGRLVWLRRRLSQFS